MSKKGGYYCAFKGCRGLSRRDKRSFFRFPKDPQRSKQWIKACKRNDLLKKTPIELFNSYRVCAKHFTNSMFLNDLKNRLQPYSVPVQLELHKNPHDLIDVEKKKNKDCENPIAKILSNCTLQKISADEFFKATGICIHEPISTIKSCAEYLQSSNTVDRIYSNVKSNENSIAINFDNTNDFSINDLNYQDFINFLLKSFINTPKSQLSTVEINKLPFMNLYKTVNKNKISKTILEHQNNVSNTNISDAIKIIKKNDSNRYKYF